MEFDTIREISHGGPLTISVDGNCMFNSVPDRAKIQVERRTFCWPGDIVVYGRQDERLVMHRFLGYVPGRHGWRGVTRADEATCADAPFSTDRILGRVIKINHAPTSCSVTTRLVSLTNYFQVVYRLATRLLLRLLSLGP